MVFSHYLLWPFSYTRQQWHCWVFFPSWDIILFYMTSHSPGFPLTLWSLVWHSFAVTSSSIHLLTAGDHQCSFLDSLPFLLDIYTPGQSYPHPWFQWLTCRWLKISTPDLPSELYACNSDCQLAISLRMFYKYLKLYMVLIQLIIPTVPLVCKPVFNPLNHSSQDPTLPLK